MVAVVTDDLSEYIGVPAGSQDALLGRFLGASQAKLRGWLRVDALPDGPAVDLAVLTMAGFGYLNRSVDGEGRVRILAPLRQSGAAELVAHLRKPASTVVRRVA